MLLSGCGGYNWLQWGGGPAHSGQNLGERSITLANVSTLHRLFVASLPVGADGAPAYLSNVSTPSGAHDALFVESELGDLVAFDAHSGAQLWKVTFSASTCRINNTQGPCYTTSSPAIDPNGRFVYVYGLDGKVHKVAIGTGAEVIDAHWPELSTLKGFDEKGSSALSIATARDGTSYLYSTHSGYPGDAGDYQGHVTAINLATGTQRVFNTLCSNLAVHFANRTAPDCPETQSGVWARGGVVYSAATDRIYLVTGNAAFSPASHHWGDTVLALNPDGSGNANGDPRRYLHAGELRAAQLAGSRSRKHRARDPSRHRHAQGAKSRRAGRQGSDAAVAESRQPQRSRRTGFHRRRSRRADPGPPGRSGVDDTNGVDEPGRRFDLGVRREQHRRLRVAGRVRHVGQPVVVAQVEERPMPARRRRSRTACSIYANGNHVDAYNPTTGAVLWTDASLTPVHWQSPIVVNGVLYMEDGGGHLYAYGH